MCVFCFFFNSRAIEIKSYDLYSRFEAFYLYHHQKKIMTQAGGLQSHMREHGYNQAEDALTDPDFVEDLRRKIRYMADSEIEQIYSQLVSFDRTSMITNDEHSTAKEALEKQSDKENKRLESLKNELQNEQAHLDALLRRFNQLVPCSEKFHKKSSDLKRQNQEKLNELKEKLTIVEDLERVQTSISSSHDKKSLNRQLSTLLTLSMFAELRGEAVVNKRWDRKRTIMGLRDEITKIVNNLQRSEILLRRSTAKLETYKNLVDLDTFEPKLVQNLRQKLQTAKQNTVELKSLQQRVRNESVALNKLESSMNAIIRHSCGFRALEYFVKNLDSIMTDYSMVTNRNENQFRDESRNIGNEVNAQNARQVLSICKTIIPLISKYEKLRGDLDRVRILNRLLEELLKTEPTHAEKVIIGKLMDPQYGPYVDTEDLMKNIHQTPSGANLDLGFRNREIIRKRPPL